MTPFSYVYVSKSMALLFLYSKILWLEAFFFVVFLLCKHFFAWLCKLLFYANARVGPSLSSHTFQAADRFLWVFFKITSIHVRIASEALAYVMVPLPLSHQPGSVSMTQ